MDPLTHSLFGAALGLSPLGDALRAPLPAGASRGTEPVPPEVSATRWRRWFPRPSPVWWLIVAANLPDLDAFLYPISADFALLCRRGVTHGGLAMVIWPVLLALLFRWCWPVLSGGLRAPRQQVAARISAAEVAAEMARREGKMVGVLALAVASHPLLDWLNTYGVRLQMPFSGRWFYGDALYIIDPWLWLGLLAMVGMASPRTRRGWNGWLLGVGFATALVFLAPTPLPAALRVVWVGALAAVVALRAVRRDSVVIWRPRLAASALGLVVIYGVAMTFAGRAAQAAIQEVLPARGVSDVRNVYVGPTLARPWLWDVVVTTASDYRLGAYDWSVSPGSAAAGFELVDSRSLLADDPRVLAALDAPSVRGFRNWMRLPTSLVEELPDGRSRVWLLDLRYVKRPEINFGAVAVELDANLQPLTPDAPLTTADLRNLAHAPAQLPGGTTTEAAPLLTSATESTGAAAAGSPVSAAPAVDADVHYQAGARLVDEPGSVQRVSDEWWGLVPDADAGTRFAPDPPLAAEYRRDGMKVVFSGTIGETPADIRMWGTPLAVDALRPAE